MNIIWNNELYHYGVPRRSGRYKWGSGKNPYHHGASSPRKMRKALGKEQQTIWKQSDQLLKANKREYKSDKAESKRLAKQEAKANKGTTYHYVDVNKGKVSTISPKALARKEHKYRKQDYKEEYKKGRDQIRRETGIAQYEAKKAYRKALATHMKDIKGANSKAYMKANRKYKFGTEKFGRIRQGAWMRGAILKVGPNMAERYTVTKNPNKSYDVYRREFGRIGDIVYTRKQRL